MIGDTSRFPRYERAVIVAKLVQDWKTEGRTEMKHLPWRDIYAWLLAVFFAVGGTMNIFASPGVVADYQGWGYPGWFHYVTGLMEWTAAALMVLPFTRLAGCVLGGTVMAAAAGTVLLNNEYAHAAAPLVLLALVGLSGWLTWRRPG